MTIKYYSASARGFASGLPDSIEISIEYYQSLLIYNQNGATIEPDANGYPVAVFPPPLTENEKLEKAKTDQIKIVDEACKTAIVSGFVSSALGAEHAYPGAPEDQINLIGAVTASHSPGLSADWCIPFSCMDAFGAWDKRAHTAVQIQQVLADGVEQRVFYSEKLAGLVAQINRALSLDDVAKIVW